MLPNSDEASPVDPPLASLTHGQLRVGMPPPPHTVMFTPPPVATFTVNALLDYPLRTPSPPSGASVGLLAAQLNRPTHTSSARALAHE